MSLSLESRNHYRKELPIRELLAKDIAASHALPERPFDCVRYEYLKADGFRLCHGRRQPRLLDVAGARPHRGRRRRPGPHRRDLRYRRRPAVAPPPRVRQGQDREHRRDVFDLAADQAPGCLAQLPPEGAGAGRRGGEDGRAQRVRAQGRPQDPRAGHRAQRRRGRLRRPRRAGLGARGLPGLLPGRREEPPASRASGPPPTRCPEATSASTTSCS